MASVAIGRFGFRTNPEPSAAAPQTLPGLCPTGGHAWSGMARCPDAGVPPLL